MNILEIGCAGGLLLHQIKKINPSVSITGLDRDSNHIAYALQKSNELKLEGRFLAGDALDLPFDENTFDLTFSHTVIEHIETQPFLREQFRVLKPGGISIVMSVRTSLNIAPENWKPASDLEKELFDKSWANSQKHDQTLGIGKYELKECDFPKALAEAGFCDIDVQFMSLMSYAPDNASVSDELALKQINTNRLHTLESVQKALRQNPQALNTEEQETLTRLINQRYDERVEKYHQGEKIWDIATSTVMVVSGKKS